MEKEFRPDDPRIVELAKHDDVIERMIERGIPITRDAYVEGMYLFGEPPKRWTSEHEEEVPEPLRDWSKVQRR
jgi:hypothetical protein